jgi:prevent-host-death family protein
MHGVKIRAKTDCLVEAHSPGKAGTSPKGTSGSLGKIAKVTIYGHNKVMKKVGIADLKSRLSEYLRAVRRGETIAVLDRQTPIAQIVPVRQMPLDLREPAPGTPAPNKIPLPRPLKLTIDIVQLLLEERQGLR